MGKGDKKSKKGKIASGSYGVRRRRKPIKGQESEVSSSRKVKKPAKDATEKPNKTTAKKKETKK